MINKIRVRFAPSPTGPLHIGGVRTALFNYLFAKKNDGDFILRIEDTDQTRFVAGAEEYIIEAMNWLNIPFDEGPEIGGDYGPYRQSERKEIYQKHIDELVDTGHAYYAFDTIEKLDLHRKEHEAKGKTFIYNWHNRLKLDNSLALKEEEVKERIKNGEKYVIRFKSPQDETLVLNDLIRGEIKIDSNLLDDKILFKSDGMPTYHLANIIDDHLMKISYVIRGEEWLPSLALHVLLYRAFDWQAPKFAHLPLILKPVGQGKLSKRDGDKLGFPVFPLEWDEKDRGYREDGYFPEAVINMLALLGWNEGDGIEKEIYSLQELVKAFSLEHVSKSGAKFNPDKTKWFNQQYLQQKSNTELTKLFIPVLEQKLIEAAKDPEANKDQISLFIENNNEYVTDVIALIKERAVFVSDFWELGKFFFVTPTSYDDKAAKKAFKEDTPDVLSKLIAVIDSIDDFSSENLQRELKAWIVSQEISFGKVMMPLRLSLVGSLQGPDVFSIMSLIGKEETIASIENAVNKLAL
ncbi:MAG: glutamate--tRNA ligase [Flavobacteriaceae bacterium]|nr:glutamate--tRNA ligase [Flavobacteriaceae bacterium]